VVPVVEAEEAEEAVAVDSEEEVEEAASKATATIVASKATGLQPVGTRRKTLISDLLTTVQGEAMEVK
jgi:hypothetical protein